MSLFWSQADATLKVGYLSAVVLTIAYISWHVIRRRYLFSPYTIVVFVYSFALLIIGPLQYSPNAWTVLLRTYSGGLSNYLSENLKVNLLGYLVMLLVMWRVESSTDTESAQKPPFFRHPPPLPFFTVKVASGISIVIFLGCIAATGGRIPLLGNRTIFEQYSSLRPIYNFANLAILFTTSTLIVFKFVSKQNRGAKTLIALGLLCMLATGGRTSFLSAVELLIILSIYRGRRMSLQTVRRTIFASAGLTLVALFGLYLASLRVNSTFSLSNSFTSTAYGNTFSDLRDGAYVMYGWAADTGTTYLHGKSFLAGLLSFLPSSGSTFRSEYSWGYYNTTTLFGYTGHYGFRGGWSLETFLNFGWVGVPIVAALNGWLLGRLERSFYVGYVRDRRQDYGSIYAYSWLGYLVHTVLIASSATYDVYSLLVVLAAFRIVRYASISTSTPTRSIPTEGASRTPPPRKRLPADERRRNAQPSSTPISVG